jgi:acetyl-CoA synthetase
MANYGIGPFDVESVLVTHPRVLETAVIGQTRRAAREVLEAFVVLRAGDPGDEQLPTELQQLVEQQFAAHAHPRRVHFVDELPKTPSGKVQRYVLRQRRRAEVNSI